MNPAFVGSVWQSKPHVAATVRTSTGTVAASACGLGRAL